MQRWHCEEPGRSGAGPATRRRRSDSKQLACRAASRTPPPERRARRRSELMSDIEARLSAAMHSAVDGQDASPNELITQVLRRHRLRTRRFACAAVLAAVAIAVPTVMAVHS